MTEHGTCPGCGHHCDLTDPRCEKGEAHLLAKTSPETERPRYSHRDSSENDQLIDALRDLSRMMRAQYEGRASQKRILIILEETGEITQRDLTERLGIQPGSASEILAKLENAGLIARTQNAEDRRTTDIRLTDSGRELAEEAAGQRRKRHNEMFSCLSEEEKQTLLALLEKLRADWIGRCQDRRYPETSEQPDHHDYHHMHREHRGRHGAHSYRKRG